MIPVRENSEVVIIYPDHIYNGDIPIAGWFHGKSENKIDDLEVPRLKWKPPYGPYSNILSYLVLSEN